MKRKFQFCKGKLNKTGSIKVNEYCTLNSPSYKVSETEYECNKCNHIQYNPVDDVCLQRYIIK